MSKRFIIGIKITKGDHRAQVIRQMSMGQVIAYNDIIEAKQAVIKFLMLVDGVVSGQFNSYGSIVIVDEKNAKIVKTYHIGNKTEVHSPFDIIDAVEAIKERLLTKGTI